MHGKRQDRCINYLVLRSAGTTVSSRPRSDVGRTSLSPYNYVGAFAQNVPGTRKLWQLKLARLLYPSVLG